MKVYKRSSNIKEYFSNMEYKKSYYNISVSNDAVSFIYNTASGAIIKINTKRYLNNDYTEEELEELVKNGIYVLKHEDEFKKYLSKINFALEKNPDFFTIIPTTACNAKCFYCYEKGYVSKTIDKKSHKKIVDYIIQNIINKDKFTLDWYGGEPLLCKDEIDEIICDIEKIIDLDRYEWSSSITTNATLFDEKLIDHAVKSWNLKIAYITLDGPEEEHNKRKAVSRPVENAFRKTYKAIIRLLNKGVFVNLRIHIDMNNIDMLEELLNQIKIFWSYDNFQVFPTFLFPPENQMDASYIKDEDKEYVFYRVFSMMKSEKLISEYENIFPVPKIKNCYATEKNKVVISPQGVVHSCVQDFMNIESTGEKQYLDYKRECLKCSKCKYFPICLGGCIYNQRLNNTVRTACVRNRYIIRPLLKLLLEEN